MRLEKFLVNSGIGSRKEVKKLIKDKRISINDKVINNSTDIDEYNDIIKLDNEKIEYHLYHYLLLYKPQGYVSATKFEKNYPPVTDLIPEYDYAHLFPVGRLDVDSTGLLLMTNDGNMAHRLLSPKFHVDKVYKVSVDYPLKIELIKKFQEGIILDGELTLPAKLEIIDDFNCYITLHEGKFHQIKRMLSYFDYKVMTLKRIKFDILTIDGLNEGEYRLLTKEEIKKLKSI